MRKQQFQGDLLNMKLMMDKSRVRVIDVKHVLDSGYKLMLEFERVYDSREKWKLKYQELKIKQIRDKNVQS